MNAYVTLVGTYLSSPPLRLANNIWGKDSRYKKRSIYSSASFGIIVGIKSSSRRSPSANNSAILFSIIILFKPLQNIWEVVNVTSEHDTGR